MLEKMPPTIANTVIELLGRCNEVWLLGSQVNPTDRAPRDWDVLAFGDLDLLIEFRRRAPIKGLDLLIVWNNDEFEGPWITHESGTKRGNLTGWEWKRSNETQATYRATKAREGDEFYVDVSTKLALRLII